MGDTTRSQKHKPVQNTDNSRQITVYVKQQQQRLTRICGEDHMVSALCRQAVRKRGIEV